MENLIPTSAAGVIVTIIALFPGILGEAVYARFAGRGWLEKDFRTYMRILGFSFVGLLVYAVLAKQFHWVPPIHIQPESYAKSDFATSQLPIMAKSIYGHVLASVLLGVVVGSILWTLRHVVSGLIGHQDAWDKFVSSHSTKRWVVVTIDDDVSYAGMLEQADVSRKPDYRDIVLLEPALYDADSKNYIATSIQYMYIRGDLIASMVALSNAHENPPRKTAINQPIFHGDK